MIKTKLILIEGFPCSGKSTTTRKLGEKIRQRGLDCVWYLEEDEPHPIDCGDFAVHGLARQMIPLWQRFVVQALHEPIVTLLESRLWQNTALFMYLGNCPVDEIFDFNRQQAQALTPLAPALIYLDQPDVGAAMERLVNIRGEEWILREIESLAAYAWFQPHRQAGLSTWLQFFREWQTVVAYLYDDWPHRKLKLVEAHADWTRAYQEIESFLLL